MVTVATFSLPSNEAKEQSVVGRAQCGEMGHGEIQHDTPVRHGDYNQLIHAQHNTPKVDPHHSCQDCVARGRHPDHILKNYAFSECRN